MSEEKVYEMPATYEEAVARKQELLNMINSYNEAIFSGEELPYSDEEIDALQEEYQILNDRLALTKEEKLEKLDDKDKIVNEDGTVVRKESFLDKLHWSFIIYPIVLIFVSIGLFTPNLVETVMTSYANKMFAIAYNNEVAVASFETSEYALERFPYFFRLFFNASWIQLAAVLLAWVAYFLFKIFKKENKEFNLQVAFVIACAVSLIAGISITINCIQAWKDFSGTCLDQTSAYNYYVYEKYMEMYYSYYGY